MRRRGLIGGVMVLAGAGVALKWRALFGHHYKPTPYDDVLARLDDRDWAARFGHAVLKTMPGFTAAAGAARLRVLLGSHSLQATAQADAKASRVLEVGGWLVPESVALMSALAATTI